MSFFSQAHVTPEAISEARGSPPLSKGFPFSLNFPEISPFGVCSFLFGGVPNSETPDGDASWFLLKFFSAWSWGSEGPQDLWLGSGTWRKEEVEVQKAV